MCTSCRPITVPSTCSRGSTPSSATRSISSSFVRCSSGCCPGLSQPLRRIPNLTDLIADTEVKWLTLAVVSMLLFVVRRFVEGDFRIADDGRLLRQRLTSGPRRGQRERSKMRSEKRAAACGVVDRADDGCGGRVARGRPAFHPHRGHDRGARRDAHRSARS